MCYTVRMKTIKFQLTYDSNMAYTTMAPLFVKELEDAGIKVDDYRYNPTLGHMEIDLHNEEDFLAYKLIYG